MAYDLSRQLTKTTKLEQTSAWFPSLEDEEDIYGRADTRIRMDVTDKMFAQISYVFQYDNTPADDAERVDHRVTVGVGWSF